MEHYERSVGRRSSAGIILTIIAVLTVFLMTSCGGSGKGSVAVGDTLVFGIYEQDNNDENGKEPLEWQVLKTEDNKALLISRYALTNTGFDVGPTLIDPAADVHTWDTSRLREALNTSFLEKTFTAEEQEAIVPCLNQDEPNPKYGIEPGNPTEDKVFLLSISEAETLFASNADRVAEPTAYAKAQGLYVSKKKTAVSNSCWWWLRSPGLDPSNAAYVGTNGDISYAGFMYISGAGLRPAVWVDLTKIPK